MSGYVGTRFDRAVAVKVLRPMDTEADRAQFDRECRVMGRLSSHPSVVTVHHGGFTAAGDPYIVMELSEEGSLADRLKGDGPIEWQEAVSLMLPIVEALDHAHRAGVLHRDVKPENILVSGGRPLLTDFGIASIRDATHSVSAAVTASWLHTAPETFNGRRDERADVYSAASTLYHLIGGHAPFQRSDDESLNPLMLRLLNDPPPALPAGRGPVELSHYLRRCLAKDPAERPAGARAMAADLRSILDGYRAAGGEGATQAVAPPQVAPPVGAPGSAQPSQPLPVGGPDPLTNVDGPPIGTARRRSLVVAIGIVVALVGGGLAFLAMAGDDDGGDGQLAAAGSARRSDELAQEGSSELEEPRSDGSAPTDQDASTDEDQPEPAGSPATEPLPVGPAVDPPTFAGPAATYDELGDRWAQSRAAVVEALSSEAYGVGDDNVLRGPGGLAVDLDRCPADWSDTTGLDDATIRIGLTAPGIGVLGDASDIGAGIDHYFRDLNERGGVEGRRVELVAREDSNDLARTQAAVDDFIGSDGVLAATTIGTPQALAVTDRLNAECVPHPFVMSAHPAMTDPVGRPFTTPGMLAWSAEAALWGQWIADNMADRLPVTVGALVMDSEFGTQGYADPFAAWVEANPGVVSDVVIVRHPIGATALVDEMTELAAAGPDVIISMTAGADCRTAALAMGEVDLGDAVRFHPTVCRDAANLLAPAGPAADGILVFSAGIETIGEPALADDPYVAHVRDRLATAGLADNGLYASGYGYYGWLWGETLQIASELPGGLTRTNLLLTAWSLDLVHPMVDDGIGYSAAGPEDPILLEGSVVLRYDAGSGVLEPFGQVDVDGKTPPCSTYLSNCG